MHYCDILRRYVWMQGASDADVLSALLALQPHAIIDLSSYTVLSRPHVVSAAAACFKINAVNYPSTMGGVFEDLLLTDPVSSPPDTNHLYGEKLLLMPGSGFPAFFADGASEVVPMAMRLGLMRDCSNDQHGENISLCSSRLGDPDLSSLLSPPPLPSSSLPPSCLSTLLLLIRNDASSPLDKAAYIFASLTSLRASLLATRQFNGTDLFQVVVHTSTLLLY
jgi:hypothetical protein